jgi:hypothetical protein
MALGSSSFDFMVSQLHRLCETNRGRRPQSRPPDFPALYLGQEKNRCPALTDVSDTEAGSGACRARARRVSSSVVVASEAGCESERTPIRASQGWRARLSETIPPGSCRVHEVAARPGKELVPGPAANRLEDFVGLVLRAGQPVVNRSGLVQLVSSSSTPVTDACRGPSCSHSCSCSIE